MINNKQEGLSLKWLFTVIWYYRILFVIVFSIVLATIFGIGLLYNGQNSKVVTYVELQWDGITEGLYPDGQRFDYSNMLGSDLYANAYDNADIEPISSTELKKSISIIPIVPASVTEYIESQLLRGEQVSYFATEFKIILNNGDLNLNLTDAQALLNSLINEFKLDFERKYISKSIIIDYMKTDLSQYDYNEAYDILSSQIELIYDITDQVLAESNNFTSAQLGFGFNNIKVRADLIRNIDLENIIASVNNYLLTKNVELLITKYKYTLEIKNLDLNKELEYLSEIETLITDYTGSSSTIIIPGVDVDIIELDPYLNNLYQEAVTTQRAIAVYNRDIAYYEIQISRLEGNDPEFIITPEKQNEEIENVEAAIISSTQQLSSVVNDLSILLEEYNLYRSRSLVKVLNTPQYEPELNLLFIAILGVLVGGLASLTTTFVKNNIDSKKPTPIKE
jgi:hypothetical protein